MRSKRLSAGIVSLLVTLTVFSMIIGSVVAEIPPPVSGIEILEYEDSIIQQAGTSGTYEVKVKNVGVLSLRDIRLESEKIPADWFSSNDTIGLEFGEVGTLRYELTLPEGASGMRAFSLITRGSYGAGTLSDIDPVVLRALVLPEPNITHTETTEAIETTEASQLETTQPSIILISEELPKLIDRLKVVLKRGPDTAFSKFRAAVAYVRTTTKDVLTNELLMYKTVALLFVVMLILAGGRKLIMG